MQSVVIHIARDHSFSDPTVKTLAGTELLEGWEVNISEYNGGRRVTVVAVEDVLHEKPFRCRVPPRTFC